MIFVTGGTGFIGAHLLIHLTEKGNKVKALKRSTSSQKFFNDLLKFYKKEQLAAQIEWLEGDLDDTPGLVDLLKGVETIYHCAGKVSFSERDWDELLAINRTGTRNLVNAAIEAEVPKFCLFSSVAALDMSQGIKGKKTDWKAFRKQQPYGYSKYLSELEVYRGHEEGLNVLVLNPAVVIGPSDKSNPLSKFIQRLKNGLKIYPTGTTGFVSIHTLCEIAIAETAKIKGQKQITVCSDNISFKESISLFTDHGKFPTPKIALKGITYQGAMLAARFCSLFGIKSELSVSGLRALTNEGGYETAATNAYENMRDLRCAVTESVDFFTESTAG